MNKLHMLCYATVYYKTYIIYNYIVYCAYIVNYIDSIM